MRLRLAISIGAIVAAAAIPAVPAYGADSGSVCRYALDLHSVDGRLFVGRAAGTFTEFTCARVGHDGTVDTLKLASGSGQTEGMISEAASAHGYFTYGGNSYADISLVSDAGARQSFRLYPQVALTGGSGTLTGNIKGESGFASFGSWGSATLASVEGNLATCVDAPAACDREWRIEGALTIPLWVGG